MSEEALVAEVATPTTTKSSMMEGLKSSPKPALSATALSAELSATSPSPTTDWWLAEGVAGVGPKPEYLNPKYKTLADQARAYEELYKTVRATAGAPEQYDFTEFEGKVDINNPHLQKFTQFAKQNRFSQDAVKEILGTVLEYENSKLPNINKEIERLGPDGPRKIETVQRWAENTFSDKALETIGKIATNADVIEFLDELRQFSHHQQTTQVPGSNAAPTEFKRESVREIEAEMKLNYSSGKNYVNNPAYRAEISARMQQAVGEE